MMISKVLNDKENRIPGGKTDWRRWMVTHLSDSNLASHNVYFTSYIRDS